MPGFYLPSSEEFDPYTDDFLKVELTKERRYRHFDLPLSEQDRSYGVGLDAASEVHRFWPLLGYSDETVRYRRGVDGKRSRETKKRPIRFASHSDSAYLQAYATALNTHYEAALRDDGTSHAVLAYRKGGRTNIHHAKSLFDEIRSERRCQVFALDITGFFDSLDHQHLKSEIQNLLNIGRLTGHHWNVFKNTTRYSWVETEDLDKLLGKRRPRRGRVCTREDFREYVQGRTGGLVRTHDLPYGIPQGTPISGLYANIYLRTFDREVLRAAQALGGSYRRYSDDLAIVLPNYAKADHLVGVVEKLIADFGLALAAHKTETARFERGSIIAGDEPFQYLGFTFDGSRTLIRPSSIDAYRRKMERGIRAKLLGARKKRIPSSEVYQRELRSRYTHVGKRRNFLKYAYRASDIMRAPEIRQQVSRHVTWFDRAWDRQVLKVYGGLVEPE